MAEMDHPPRISAGRAFHVNQCSQKIMCGIVGFSGQFDWPKIVDGLGNISHRGPDDSGHFFDASSQVALGHVRLSIIDVSAHGHQPMVSEDKSVVLAFNGEIYNFRELRTELEAKGYRFKGHSDTEVLLNLYVEEGESFLTRLNGIFAFALWDARHKHILLARDALGVKPLYVATDRYGVAFCSEVKGLLPLISDAQELDFASIHRYVSFLWCPGEGTPLRNVRKLPPGEAVSIRAGKVIRRWRWFNLPVFDRHERPLLRREAVFQTRTLLRQAVHRQLVADVPVGALLSGGLDSSAVVAFARELNPDIQCFTIAPSGGDEDGTAADLPYAERVSKHLGVPLEVVNIDANKMVSCLERMVVQLDEPIADPACLNILFISESARRQGIKVLLSGTGGDDLFAGYRRHRAVQAEKLWSWLPKAIRARMDRVSACLDQRKPVLRRISKLFNGAGLSGDERLVSYFAWARNADLMQLYTPEFREQLEVNTAGQPMLEFLEPLGGEISSVDRMLALEQRFFLADHNLIYTDKMSMAAGVEVRVPFLDLDLLRAADRIPVRFKQRGNVGKWVLKKAMEPVLPRDVIYRPKTGFGAPLRRWIKGELRELLEDLLSVETLRRRRLFDPLAVQRLIADNNVGRVDATYTLFSLLCVEIWCQQFLDKPL